MIVSLEDDFLLITPDGDRDMQLLTSMVGVRFMPGMKVEDVGPLGDYRDVHVIDKGTIAVELRRKDDGDSVAEDGHKKLRPVQVAELTRLIERAIRRNPDTPRVGVDEMEGWECELRESVKQSRILPPYEELDRELVETLIEYFGDNEGAHRTIRGSMGNL